MGSLLGLDEGTFGVPLEILMERYGSKIDLGHGPNPKSVPFLIAESIRAMSTMGMGCFVHLEIS